MERVPDPHDETWRQFYTAEITSGRCPYRGGRLIDHRNTDCRCQYWAYPLDDPASGEVLGYAFWLVELLLPPHWLGSANGYQAPECIASGCVRCAWEQFRNIMEEVPAHVEGADSDG